jgi:hypothetical protein
MTQVRFLVIVFAATIASAAGFQQTPVTSEAQAARQRDVYAIYSKMISSPDEIVLIEGTTLLQPSPDTLACTQPPAEEEARFKEVLNDYDLRKDVAVALANEFTLDRKYQLLTREEARTFLYDAYLSTPQVVPPGGIPPNTNPLFPRARRVFRLGDVYFNQNRSLALSYVSVMTTTVDGSGGWKVFRKDEAGVWQEATSGPPARGQAIWTTCGWGRAH